MFSLLQKEIGKRGTNDIAKIKEILNSKCFEDFGAVKCFAIDL